MPRKIREERPLVYVFSEGESEQAYVDFLKERFEENVRIMRPKGTGLFDEAWDKFRKDKKYKDALEVIDEIWFFPADKDRRPDRVKSLVQDYENGDPVSTKKIAGNYMTAILNGEKVLNSLRSDGIPTLEDTDERNTWLSKCGLTFTTVHEAVKWLEERRNG